MFRIKVCEKCEKQVIYQSVNGFGYCMYCGSKLDDNDSYELGSAVGALLNEELAKGDHQGKKWSNDYLRFTEAVNSYDFKKASAIVRKIQNNNESTEDINDTIIDFLKMKFVEFSKDPERTYKGGVDEILQLMGKDYQIYIKELVLSCCEIDFDVNDRIQVRSLINTLFYLVVDILRHAPSLLFVVLAIMPISNVVCDAMDAEVKSGVRDEDRLVFTQQLALGMIISISLEFTKGVNEERVVMMGKPVDIDEKRRIVTDGLIISVESGNEEMVLEQIDSLFKMIMSEDLCMVLKKVKKRR